MQRASEARCIKLRDPACIGGPACIRDPASIWDPACIRSFMVAYIAELDMIYDKTNT